MPTYEYACRSCGSHLEVVQAFSDEPLTGCPTCGGPLRKVFGSIGITFKGSGFYRTDSRSSTGRRRDGETADTAKKTDTTESATKGDRGGKGDSGGKGSESSSSGGAKESTAAKSA
jgi:putative FmdB family regulatory protein